MQKARGVTRSEGWSSGLEFGEYHLRKNALLWLPTSADLGARRFYFERTSTTHCITHHHQSRKRKKQKNTEHTKNQVTEPGHNYLSPSRSSRIQSYKAPHYLAEYFPSLCLAAL